MRHSRHCQNSQRSEDSPPALSKNRELAASWAINGIADYAGELTREKLWYSGKYSFAAQDARQWAEWGFDYLKYDWNPHDWYSMKEMHDELEKCGRDIVYSLLLLSAKS